MSRVSPSTSATASPTKRTVRSNSRKSPGLTSCSGGRSSSRHARSYGGISGNAASSASRSTTATTPSRSRAAAVSIERIRACGYGLRTNRPWSMPGSTRSPAYRRPPRAAVPASIRGTLAPTLAPTPPTAGSWVTEVTRGCRSAAASAGPRCSRRRPGTQRRPSPRPSRHASRSTRPPSPARQGTRSCHPRGAAGS